MATQKYPAAIVSTTELPTTRADATLQATNHANDHDQIALELIAIETELGTNPKGTSASVRARLDKIQPSAPSAYTVSNAGAADRNIDISSTTLGEFLNVFATLVSDLQARGIIG